MRDVTGVAWAYLFARGGGSGTHGQAALAYVLSVDATQATCGVQDQNRVYGIPGFCANGRKS